MIKNNKGVTLVELLIVIVILGIIAAVSIPAVGNIVENSQKDAVLAEASSIRSGANTCIAAGDCEYNTTTGWLEYTGSGAITEYVTSTNTYEVHKDGYVWVQVGDWYFFGNPSIGARTDVDAIDTNTVPDDSAALDLTTNPLTTP